MTTQSNSDAALDAYMAAMGKINTLLNAIRAAADDHHGVMPEEIHFGHVGDLNHVIELLGRAAAFLKNTPDATVEELLSEQES